jgi:hypothetical protein
MTFTLGYFMAPHRLQGGSSKNSANTFNNFSSVITFSHARARTFAAPLIAREDLQACKAIDLTSRRVRELEGRSV